MEIFIGFLSDLIAGLIGAAVLTALVLLFQQLGKRRGRQWANKLRRLAWPFVTLIFFATALTSAILRGHEMPLVVLLAVILVLGLVSIILLRYGPKVIRRFGNTLRSYSWPILTVVFFLSTLILLVFGPGSATYGERIVFVVDLADEEMMVLRDILDELEPELGSEVFLINVDKSRYVARMDHMVASNDMKWDLIAVDNNKVGLVVKKGLVEDLSKYVEYDELVPQSLLPSVRPTLKFEGRFCFAPFRPNVKIAFYNEQKFKKYGLRPPMTWEELLDVAETFYKEEGVGRVAIQGYPGPATAVTVFEFVTAAGGNPLSLDDDGSKSAFAFLQKLEPYLAPGYAETRFDTANELLIDDEVYLVSNWTYGIKVVVEDAGKKEIKAYRGWRGPQGEVHVLGGDVLAVPTGAPHPNEAIKLIELLLAKETQQKLLSRLRWLPVRLDAYEGTSSEMAPYFKAINEALAFAKLRPTAPQWTMVECVLDRAFRGIVQEGNDIGSLEEYSASLEKIPSEYICYTVVPGDTLEVIARGQNTTVTILAETNGITTRTSVSPGQILLVPQQ